MPQNDILHEHFERLKELIPEVYSRNLESDDTDTGQLFGILKRTLRIVEAVYLQHEHTFNNARMEEYGKIIRDLEHLGYRYEGNPELLEKAAGQLLMKAKKPMARAKGSSKSTDEEGRKAI